MNELARSLAPVLPWILFLIVVLLAVVVVALTVVLRRARRAAAPPSAAEPKKEEAKDALGSTPGVSKSFARAVAALRSYVPGRGARYRIPWVAVLGPAGAGVSSVSRAVDLPRPFASPTDNDDPRHPDLGWQFFEGGVLLDVPGGWVLDRDGTGHDEQGWRTFLRHLERWRPDRPLDAVVLAIPANDLMGPDAPGRSELLARADALRERLSSAQRRLGLRFPVHILITRCDRVPGFTAMCRELPEAARDEIFGWSSPYPLEAAFAPEWVDQAFDAVHADLYETQVELLAGCDAEVADGVFRFPGELRRLHPGLRAFLGEVFRESVYREAFFFRGLYFTGDAAAHDPETDHVDEAREPAAASAAPVAPIFLRHLFAERVFAETGLARASGGSVRARGRWARAAQMAAAALVIIGIPGLLLSYRRLDATGDRAALTMRNASPVARVLAREGRSTAPSAGGRVDVVGLVDQIVAIPTDQLWSVFIPQSWPGGVRRDLEAAQAAVFGDAVLPAMRKRLLTRADELLPPDDAMGPVIDPTPTALPDYLDRLGALSTNVNRYNRLATPDSASPADLQGLSAYLYDHRTPARPGRAKAYQRALRLTAAQRIAGDRTARALDLVQYITEEVYARLGATLTAMEDRLQGAPDPAAVFLDGTVPEAGFDPRQLGSYFAGGDSAWLAPSAPVPARVDSALDGIPSSALLSAPRLQDGVESRFTAVRGARLTGIESASGDGDGDATGAPAGHSLVSLRDALATLRGQSFADFSPPVRLLEGESPPSAPVVWDTLGLARAASRYDAYEKFVAGPQVAALTPRGQALVKSLAATQLEAGMSRDVARSARPVAAPASGLLPFAAERELRARVAAFAPATALLARIAGAYERTGRTAAYDDLAAYTVAQGSAVLAGATDLLEARGAYTPRDGDFSWWRGDRPVSFPAFGVRDTASLQEYVDGQREAVQEAYTLYAEPVLSLLYSDALAPFLASSPGASAAAAEWRELGSALAAYQAKKPSSLSALENFIHEEMGEAAPGNCAPVARSPRGGDWFADRARALQAPLYARCRQLSASWVQGGYERIRAAFASSLAGRFPFAAPDTRAEADPEAVRAFLAMYDEMAEVRAAVASGREGVGGRGSPAAAFLARMDAASRFLAPLMAADTGGGPAYRVSADFRVNRGREIGADQVADWSMMVGSERLSPRDSAGEATPWDPGDPVSLAFRWAAGSPVRPSAAGLAPGMRVDGSTLGYGAGGRWALFRLIRSRAASPRLLATSPDRVAHTLAFPATTTAVPQPARATSIVGAVPGEALLFVRVEVLHPGTGSPLVLPPFPSAAPALDR